MHTPGPWIVANGLQVWVDGGSALRSARICTIQNGADVIPQIPADEQAANARLIVAAPDMIAALRYVEWQGVAVVCGEEYSCCPGCGGMPKVPEQMHLAYRRRQTIGHAEGCKLADAIRKATDVSPR